MMSVQQGSSLSHQLLEDVILSIRRADFKTLTNHLKDPRIDFNSVPRGYNGGPIHEAVSHPSQRIALSLMELLLYIGLDVNLRRIHDAATALHIASQNKYWDVAKVLLDFGADGSILNADGEAPRLNLPEEQTHVEINRISMEHIMDGSMNTSSLSSLDASFHSAKSCLESGVSFICKEDIITYATPLSKKVLVETRSESAMNILANVENEDRRNSISGTLRRLPLKPNECIEDSESYPSPLNSTTPRNLHRFNQHHPDLLELDAKMSKAFRTLVEEQPELKNCINVLTREGILKSSFNYLLLDSRVTQNLPIRTLGLGDQASWNIFLKSIFYIGKGTRSRPLHHLLAALETTGPPRRTKNSSSKTQTIRDIWESGHGVVNLQVFNNSIAVEALTRESSMIQAIGLDNISNSLKGDVYGVVKEWSSEDIRLYGTYLLYRAFKIFLVEGERHLKPADIKPKRI